MLQRAETSDSHRMSPTRPEINTKSFVFWHVFRSSRWYLPIWVMSLHIQAPFVKNFHFFIFGIFPIHQAILGSHENHSGDTSNPNVHETQAQSEKTLWKHREMHPKNFYRNRSSYIYIYDFPCFFPRIDFPRNSVEPQQAFSTRATKPL